MWSQWSLGSNTPPRANPSTPPIPLPTTPPPPPLNTLHNCLKDRCRGRGDSKFSLCGWILTLWPLMAYDYFQSKLEFSACSTWVLNSQKFTKGFTFCFSPCREQNDEQSNPNLTVLSWNVDGLDERNILERTRNVCHIINNSKPDAVFLQEVITQTLAIYQSKCPG